MLVLIPPPYIPHLLIFVISVIACICIVSISIDMVRCYFLYVMIYCNVILVSNQLYQTLLNYYRNLGISSF